MKKLLIALLLFPTLCWGIDLPTIPDQSSWPHGRDHYLDSWETNLESSVTGGSDIWIQHTNGTVTSTYTILSNAVAAITDGDHLYFTGTHTITPGLITGGLGNGPVPLRLDDKSDIVIEGVGGATVWGPGNGTHLTLRRCTNITVKGITFLSDKSDMRFEDVGTLYSCIQMAVHNETIRFVDLNIIDGGGHGINHFWDDKRSKDVWIDRCLFKNLGDNDVDGIGGFDGAAVSGIGPGWKITNCTIIDCVRGTEVEDSFTGVFSDQIIVSGNSFTNIEGHAIMLFATGANSSNYCEIITSDNTVDGAEFGIEFMGGHRLHAFNNTIKNTTGPGISYGHSQGSISRCNISDNSIFNAGTHGIRINGSHVSYTNTQNIISGNLISECGLQGIIISGGPHLVTDNMIYNCGTNTAEAAGINIKNDAAGYYGAQVILANNVIGSTRSSAEMDYGIWVSGEASVQGLHDNYIQYVSTQDVFDERVNTVVDQQGWPMTYSFDFENETMSPLGGNWAFAEQTGTYHAINNTPDFTQAGYAIFNGFATWEWASYSGYGFLDKDAGTVIVLGQAYNNSANAKVEFGRMQQVEDATGNAVFLETVIDAGNTYSVMEWLWFRASVAYSTEVATTVAMRMTPANNYWMVWRWDATEQHSANGTNCNASLSVYSEAGVLAGHYAVIDSDWTDSLWTTIPTTVPNELRWGEGQNVAAHRRIYHASVYNRWLEDSEILTMPNGDP